jgi:hypothetical protein
MRTPAVNGIVFEPHDTGPSRLVPTRMQRFEFGTAWRLMPESVGVFVAIYTIGPNPRHFASSPPSFSSTEDSP